MHLAVSNNQGVLVVSENIIRETFPVGPLACNCTILGNKTTGEAIVIDPGGDADKILGRLKELNLTLKRIIHTHAHLDHFLASGDLKEKTGVNLALHREDFPLWQHLETQCQMFGLPYKPVPDPDQWLQDDEDLGFLSGVCMHTPGHSPGSMSFWFSEANLLIAGDTLFKGSIGRTDLWGGDSGLIKKSIQSRLYKLNEAAVVVSGHGPDTSIGQEMRFNAIIRADS